ncbi:MAG TPA: flagellar biosynthesis anti-sigma factor FlgM [Roseateles sp.]
MRIQGSNPAAGVGPLGGATSEPTAPATPAAPAEALASATLRPAQQELAELPEIDAAKVARLREALANGEISFDADRLASLIQRFHGGRS